MSLVTLKNKTINNSSSAITKSGKLTNENWMYQGPYGKNGNLPSEIFYGSLITPNGNNYYNSGFSINGSYRNVSYTGSNMAFSKSGTPYRGIYPKGWGGSNGRYPDSLNEISLNITPVETGVAIQNNIVKPSVLSNKGMITRRFRWINSGQYPNNWVQPVYTGNLTNNKSQQLYIQNKISSNYYNYDVNNKEKYVNYFKCCDATGCHKSSAHTITVQQSNAPYTKTLYKPKDSSDYIIRIQRRCQNQVGLQKPFPYAVQNGTGILKGGISVTNVGNSCNISNTTTIPPNWYTGVSTNEDGTKTTLKEQLEKSYNIC